MVLSRGVNTEGVGAVAFGRLSGVSDTNGFSTTTSFTFAASGDQIIATVDFFSFIFTAGFCAGLASAHSEICIVSSFVGVSSTFLTFTFSLSHFLLEVSSSVAEGVGM